MMNTVASILASDNAATTAGKGGVLTGATTALAQKHPHGRGEDPIECG